MPETADVLTQLKMAVILNLQKLEGLNQQLDQLVQTAKEFSDTTFALNVGKISQWNDFFGRQGAIDEALKALQEAFNHLQRLSVFDLKLDEKLEHATYMKLGKIMREIDRQRERLGVLFTAAQAYIFIKSHKAEDEKQKRMEVLNAAVGQANQLLEETNNQKNYEHAAKLLRAQPVLLAQRIADAKARLGGGGHVRSQSTPSPVSRTDGRGAFAYKPTSAAGSATVGVFGRNAHPTVEAESDIPREESKAMARRAEKIHRDSQRLFGDGEKQSLLGKKPKSSSCCCWDTSAADTPPLSRRTYGAI
jgi:hypothetical protein